MTLTAWAHRRLAICVGPELRPASQSPPATPLPRPRCALLWAKAESSRWWRKNSNRAELDSIAGGNIVAKACRMGSNWFSGVQRWKGEMWQFCGALPLSLWGLAGVAEGVYATYQPLAPTNASSVRGSVVSSFQLRSGVCDQVNQNKHFTRLPLPQKC